jgi:hypothetical protein
MMPPLLAEGTPPGERTVFERLSSDPATVGWYVLHSLHLTDVRNQLEGEIDFVVVVPSWGIVCIEVKSHGRVIREDDGIWRLGASAPSARSPFEQASRGMYSLRAYLESKGLALDDVPITSCVWFTNAIASINSTIEWQEWQLLDLRDLRKPTSEVLLGILSQHRMHLDSRHRLAKNTHEPSKNFARKIADCLRPMFELSLDTKAVRTSRDRERQSFLEDQYEALDLMANSPRILFEGAAGTGKTNVAIEAASRAAASGKKVLFLCFNTHLGSLIKTKFSSLPNVTAGTLHSFMVTIASISVPEVPEPTFWTQSLPDEALLSALDMNEPYDVLIIDEAQDIVQERYLDVIDACLRGGLAGGTWRMFADFERQSVYGRKSDRSILGERSSDYVTGSLTRNCRNTPLIGAAALQLSGLGNDVYSGYRRRNDGVIPTYRSYTNDLAQEKHLLSAIEMLKDDKYSLDEIVVLSAKGNGIATNPTNALLKSILSPYGSKGGGVKYETVHAFKGLDSPAIIITDILSIENDYDKSLFYIAITRACDRLVVLAHHNAMNAIARIITGGSRNAS